MSVLLSSLLWERSRSPFTGLLLGEFWGSVKKPLVSYEPEKGFIGIMYFFLTGSTFRYKETVGYWDKSSPEHKRAIKKCSKGNCYIETAPQ